MRLHRLEIQAFGPFRERQVVDFDNLSAAGLFLLHGSTGAGKSSVLDAVCFALFGRVPGPRAAVTALRSHYADTADLPEVELEFSVGPRRMLVTRSPSWERPKKRGEGTTTTQAKVIVQEWVDEAWQPRATRLDEAGLLLQDVLGMGPEEFTKLVLLPQGEFAAFLRADAETRRTLLEKIFGTDRYTAVQDWIRDQRARARADLDAVDRRTHTLLAQAEQVVAAAMRSWPEGAIPTPAGNASDAGGAGATTDTAASLAAGPPPAQHLGSLALQRVEELTAALGPMREQALNDHLELAAEAEKAEVRLAQGQAMAQLAGQFSALVERQQAVEARAGEIEQRRARLDSARRAAPLSAMVSALSEARAAVAQARRRLEPLARSLLSGPDDPAPAAPDLDDPALAARWTDERDRVTAEIAGLTALAPALAEQERVRAEVTAAEQSCAAGRAALDQTRRDLAEATSAVDRAEAARVSARVVAATLEADQVALDAARRRAAAVAERDRLQQVLTGLDHQVIEAREAVLATREHYLDVRERRLRGLAAELAATLEDGQPCRVCGATEHPTPAAPAQDAVSAEDENAARGDTERAGAVLSEVTARRAGERAALTAQAEIAGGLDAAAAALELEHAEERLATSRSAAAEAVSLQEQAEQSRQTAALARAGEQESALRTQTAERNLDVLRARFEALATRVADQLDRWSEQAATDAVSVAHALSRAKERRELVESALTAHASLRDANHHLHTVEDAASSAAVQAGFTDLAHAVPAVLDDAAMAALERGLIEHTVEAESVDEQLTDERFTVLHEADASVLDGEALRLLTLEREQMTLREHEALGRAAVCDNAVAELEQLAAGLSRHVAVSAPAAEEFAALDDLARCLDGTGGDNTMRMSLSAYVLAARLEQVASAASVRLAQMSGGRYALVHTDVAGRGRSRAGLTLEVVDAWTGVRRSTATLSGGEAFYTSLALALGLADVVSAEAGGVHLDTLFIDEGFGSLDEDTLEEVMDTLDELRAGGRAVGIVSHLAELRQRIGVRLDVTKSERGSTLTLAS